MVAFGSDDRNWNNKDHFQFQFPKLKVMRFHGIGFEYQKID